MINLETESIRLLGIPFGEGDVKKKLMDERLAASTFMFDSMRCLGPQLCYALLKICCVPRWTYMATLGTRIEHWTAAFDAHMRETFEKAVVGAKVTDVMLQARAGAGLPLFQTLGPFLQSDSIRFAQRYWEWSDPPPLDAGHSPTDMFEEQLVSDNSTLKTAVAIFATGNHARAWMIPVADKTMSNHEFMDAMRLRCAVPLSVCQSTCACGKSLSPDNTSDLHLLKCPAGSSPTSLDRRLLWASRQLKRRQANIRNTHML